MKNTNMIRVLVFVIMLIPAFAKAQDSIIIDHSKGAVNREATSYHNHFSAQIGFADPFLGICYERLLSPHWGLDVAVGVLGGSIGTKLYFPKLSPGKVSFYGGITESIVLLTGPRHYIPVGFAFLAKSRFRISVDAGPQLYHKTGHKDIFGFSLKIGGAF